ncbi:MAG: hypothetical protein ACE5JX_17210 [Acidobacteriota bacterium]
MNPKKSLTPFVLLFGLLGLPAALATSVRTVNMADMVRYADRVFRGRCLSVTRTDAVAGFAALEYTFEIVEGIKGVRTGDTIVFRQVQSGRGTLGAIPGIPHYQSGQEIVLFLHADSRIGLTSPVGLSQGVFRLRRGDKGEISVLNGLGNRNLGLALASATAREMGLTRQEDERLHQGGPLPLTTLFSAVRKIDRYQRSRARVLR